MAYSTDEVLRLVLEIAGQEGVDKARTKLDELETSSKKAAGAADKHTQSTINTGQAMLQTGRIVQDFVQGGIGGILNNVEGFTAALGLGSGLAGLFTGVGVACYLALPKVRDLFHAVIDGANKVPESADKVERLNDALSKTSKELDELKGKQTLTNTELARFNELTQTATTLQGELTEAKERAAAFDRLRKQKSNEQQETAADVATLIGPGIDDVLKQAQAGAVSEGMTTGPLLKMWAKYRELQRAPLPTDQFGGQGMGMGGVRAQRDAELQRQMAAITAERARLEDEAKKTVGGAVQGDQRALGRLVGLLPPGQMRAGLSDLTPDARRRQDSEVEAADAEGERLHRAGAARRRQARQVKMEQDAIDRYEDEGGRDAKHWLADQDRKAKQAAADKARAAKADDAEMMAAAAPVETPHQQAMNRARRDVTAVSRDQGFGTPTAEQADEMANQAIRNMTDGMNQQQAAWAAVMRKVEMIQATAAQFRAMQARQVSQSMSPLGF